MNTKNAGIILLLIILLPYSSLLGEQPGEAAIVVPIIKLHALPSAESDIKGFAYSGQHFIIDGESGSWYRVRFNDATSAWVTKNAVNVLTTYNPESYQPLAASSKIPVVAQQSVATTPSPLAGVVTTSAEPVVAPAPRQATNTTAGQSAAGPGSPNNGPTAVSFGAVGYQSGAAAQPSGSSVPVIAQTGKAAVSLQKVSAIMPSGPVPAMNPAKTAQGLSAALPAYKAGVGTMAEATGATTSPLFQGAVDQQHLSAGATPLAAPLATASPIARPLASSGADVALAMRATAAAQLATTPQGRGTELGTEMKVLKGGSTPEEVEAALIRNGGRAMAPLKRRTWFSQFSHFGKTQSGGDIAFFQVSGNRSAVYSLASTDAGVLIIAEKGDFFPLLEKNTAWCKVALKDTTGWIERSKGIVVSTPTAGISEEWSFVVIVFASLVVVAVLLLFLRHKARVRKRAIEKKIGEGSALEGNIAESNLPEVLQFIEIGKKTGCLQIEDAAPLGIIYFTEGRIVHAAAIDNISGREAVNYILGLQKGSFRFLLDKQPKVRDLDLSTLEVLMEWTKSEDEAHRH